MSSTVVYALMSFPEVRVFPMEYDQSIPEELVTELMKVERLSFVKIGQHGYNHSYGESFSDIMKGYEIMKKYSLDVDYYIPPYEIAPKYPVPAELFMLSYESSGTCYSDEKMDYGQSTLNNSKMIAVHIQDDISMKMLEVMTSGREFEYLRVDDINTDIVEPDIQIKRIYDLLGFCDRKSCTLVIGVIPHVLRLQQSDRSYLLLNKMLLVIGVMTMMPIYMFYLISHHLSRWFR